MKYLLMIAMFYVSSAYAAFNNYDYYWPKNVASYFQTLNQLPAGSAEGAPNCQPLYKSFIDRGALDIHYALGYFDESYANQLYFTQPGFKLSTALDGISFDVIRNFMALPCDASSPQRLCGFTESGDPASGKVSLTKQVSLMGKTIAVTMTLTHASASESYADNKSILQNRQKMLTAQSEDNYFNGLKSADVIFYNGHSRNGGGPDFHPPILLESTLHPNYPLYEKQQVGIKRLMQSLRASGRKDQIIGMFSCFTHRHFLKDFNALNPKQKLILTEDEVDYLTTLMASLGYLESILRGQCGAAVDQLALQTPLAQRGFTDWNFTPAK